MSLWSGLAGELVAVIDMNHIGPYILVDELRSYYKLECFDIEFVVIVVLPNFGRSKETLLSLTIIQTRLARCQRSPSNRRDSLIKRSLSRCYLRCHVLSQSLMCPHTSLIELQI